MVTKILRDGRCNDVSKDGAKGVLSMTAFPMIWPAVGCAMLFFSIFPDVLVDDARSGLYVVLVYGVFWLLFLSACHFGWYVWKHDWRYYLADLPEFYFKEKHPWLAMSLFVGMPFLMVSGLFLGVQRFRQSAEDDQNTQQIWDAMEAYVGPTFETKSELEEFTARQREGFVQFCQEAQRNCSQITTVRKIITKPTGAKATKIKFQPIDEPEKFAEEAIEMFNFLLKQTDIIQIRTDGFVNGERCLELYVRARPYSSKTHETYDAGDYHIILHGQQCDVYLLRSGMSANGKVQDSLLDYAHRGRIEHYARGQILAAADPDYNYRNSTLFWIDDAPRLRDVLTVILRIVNVVNEPRLLVVKEEELQCYYRKSVDCYYDTVTSGLKFYVQNDR